MSVCPSPGACPRKVVGGDVAGRVLVPRIAHGRSLWPSKRIGLVEHGFRVLERRVGVDGRRGERGEQDEGRQSAIACGAS